MNLQRTQAAWTALMREFGAVLKPIKVLRDLERRFDLRRARVQVREINDVNGFTSAWTVAGPVIGTNLAETARLFVRIEDETPGAGQAQVSIYRAAGGAAGDLVMRGSGPNSTTVALAAQNASGLTGTVAIGVVTASEANDQHQLEVFPDWGVIDNAVFTGAEVEHNDTLRDLLAQSAASRAGIRAAINQWLASARTFILGRMANFARSSQLGPITRSTTVDDGTVTSVYTGVLEDLRRAMIDETVAGAQTVRRNTVTAAAGVADAANQGLGALAAPVMEEWAEAGLITLACVDETVGRERFEVSMRLDATNEVRRAVNNLQVRRTFSDPVLGIQSARLTRRITRTAGADASYAAQTGDEAPWTFSGETENNTDAGQVYFTIVASGANFIYRGYRRNTLLAADQVCESPAVAAATSFTLSQTNNSGLTGTGRSGAAPVVGAAATYNLNAFRAQRTTGPQTGVPDVWTVVASVTARGEFADVLGQEFGYRLNGAAAGETISDEFVRAATFPAYEVRDA